MLKLQYFGHLMQRSDSLEKSLMLGKMLVGEGDDRGWDGWMASLTRWTWVWASFGSWCWTGKPGVLQSMGSQRSGHDWATELNWTEQIRYEGGWAGQVSLLDSLPFYLIRTDWTKSSPPNGSLIISIHLGLLQPFNNSGQPWVKYSRCFRLHFGGSRSPNNELRGHSWVGSGRPLKARQALVLCSTLKSPGIVHACLHPPIPPPNLEICDYRMGVVAGKCVFYKVF